MLFDGVHLCATVKMCSQAALCISEEALFIITHTNFEFHE